MRIFSEKWFLRVCVLLCMVLPAIESSSQNFNIRTFTTRDGLAHNEVGAMAVDSLGFLWVATWDGLSRFDGYSFKNYFHNPDDPLSLPYFTVGNVVVDGGNNLWIWTDLGKVALYDRIRDNFIIADSLNAGLPETINDISIDESGHLWLITRNTLFRFDHKKRSFERYQIYDADGSMAEIGHYGESYTISINEKNKIWLTGFNVYEFEKQAGNKLIIKRLYKVDPLPEILGSVDFHVKFWFRIYHSESGRRWIFSNTGLFLFDEKAGEFREFREQIPPNEFKGDTYLFWSWYYSGINLYDPGQDSLLKLPEDYCQLVRCVFIQNKNLIWFSNSSKAGASLGLNRVIFTPDYFTNYPVISQKGDIPAVYAITRDRFNRTWVGLRGTHPLRLITPDFKTLNVKLPQYDLTTNPGAIRSLTTTYNGIWIGFFKELLLFYDFDTGGITRHPVESHGFRPVDINDSGELYIIGNKYGLIVKYSPERRQVLDSITFEIESPIYKILADKREAIWLSTNYTRIIHIDPVTGLKEVITLSKGNYNVEDICPGENGDLWLSTLGGGVCVFNPLTGKKTFYTTSDGLANNMTYSILKDNSGYVWVSTNTGISRINPHTGMIRNFGINDGLNIIEFNSGASYADKNGEFLMGGMGGVVGFYPDEVNKEESVMAAQKPIITEIRVSGVQKHYRQRGTDPDTVILKKGENNIQVFYSSSDFINSEKTVYRYMLSKIDGDWVESDSRNRNTSYANLKPGWYDFHLQVTDRNGSWTPSKEIKIRLLPYYYQTTLFRIATPVIILLMVAGMIIIYISNLKQREAQKQNALKLQALRGQMNPHFIFNSLNSINYFISENDKLSANRYIGDFSRLIRSILQNLSHDYILLEKEIESIQDYLKIEHLRFGDKFDFSVMVDDGIIHSNIKVAPGLIQPFVENAIWHGVRGLETRKGKIELLIGKKDGRLICKISDDGIGRKKAEAFKGGNDKQKSKGISIALERLRIINGLQGSHCRIEISDLYPDKDDSGTVVEIDIPTYREWAT